MDMKPVTDYAKFKEAYQLKVHSISTNIKILARSKSR